MTTIQIDRAVVEQALEALDAALSDDKPYIAVSRIAANQLRAALENQFNPDWDRVEALQESLREHMADVRQLRAALAWIASHKSSDWSERCQQMVDKAREALSAPQPEQTGEADELLRNLGLDPETYRTDCGYINHLKVKAAIRYPENYPQRCNHEWVAAPASLGGNLCRKCGTPERCTTKAQKQEPAGEPVAWVVKMPGGYHDCGYDSGVLNKVPHGTMLYTAPPAPKRLTDDEIWELWTTAHKDGPYIGHIERYTRAIEAKLRGEA